MKLFVYFYCRLLVFLFLVVFSVPILAYIPPEIEFTAVFDYENMPVSGNQTVTVRLFNSGSLIYKEVVNNVYFDKGVAKIVIGGEDSDLLNSYFDNPKMIVSISVKQHQLTFPVNSIPYTIRSKESNKARRIDNEAIIKFFEEKRRVAVSTQNADVTLDVNGVVLLHTKRESDQLSNGVIYWNGNENEFVAYRNGDWVSMSWIPDPEDRSKWFKNKSNNSIFTAKPVGIGRAPNLDALTVSQNVLVDNDVTFLGNLSVLGSAKLQPSAQGFDATGELKVPAIQFLNTTNFWSNSGNLTFSGVLHGSGSNLLNLHHFDQKTFDTTHFGTGVVTSPNLIDQSIYSEHMTPGIILLSHLTTNQVTTNYIADYAIEQNHIVDKSIQTHHLRKNEIGSEDIKLNTFLNEKYAPDAILSSHIVDRQITSAKIMTGNILASHLMQDFISTEKINNSTLTGVHVPTASIPISNFNGSFAINRGGTGQTAFQNYGVLYVNSAQSFTNNPNVFSIKDGMLGVGTLPETDASITVKKASNAFLGIKAKAANLAGLKFRNSVASWDVKVKADGALSFLYRNLPVLSFSTTGKVAIGTESVSEVLTLSGPIVLGSAKSATGVPGSIRYQSGQFSIYKTAWTPITSGQLAKRFFHPSERTYAHESSIIFSNNSAISGQYLMIHAAHAATISGAALAIDGLNSSNVSGAFGRIYGASSSQIFLHGSDASFMSDSNLQLTDASLAFAHQSNAHLNQSHVRSIANATISSSKSDVSFLTDSSLSSEKSQLSFIDDAQITTNLSSVSFVKNAFVTSKRSQLAHFEHGSASLNGSDVSYAINSTLDLKDSFATHLNNATLSGQGHLLLGGEDHHIMGNHYLGLYGDRHHVVANAAIGIGHDLNIDHDRAILINASDQPLTSDRQGQLKIQADGGVYIQFSPDMGIAMTDAMGGWSHISDQTMKIAKTKVDPIQILRKVSQLPVQYWQYKSQENIQHIGPTAQDFYALFNYGNSDKIIHSIDSDGVLLASIKGLNIFLDELKFTIETNQDHIQDHANQMAYIIKKIDELALRFESLEVDYLHNFRLLDQFDKDFQSQETMIAFIQSVLHRHQWDHYLAYIFSPLRFIAFVCFGVILGSAGYFIFLRLMERRP